MAKQMVSVPKQTKRQQKEYYSKRRGSWGDVKPVTRIVKSKKIYNRKKIRQEDNRSLLPRFDCVVIDALHR